MRVQVTKFEPNQSDQHGETRPGGMAQCVTETGDVGVIEVREELAKVIKAAGAYVLTLAPRVVQVAYTGRDGKPKAFGRTVFVPVAAVLAQAK